MRQNISRTQNGLLSAVNLAIAGYTKNAATVTLATNTGAALTLSRSQAITARAAFDQGKSDLADHRETLEIKIAEARAFGILARDILRPALGRKFSANWIGTGFTRSLEVPTKATELEPLMESFANYFTDNPTKESPTSNITADKADELYTALYNARVAVAGQEAANRTLIETRNAKFDTLYKRLAGMVKELSQVLTPLDGRWIDYGFQMPGLQQTPPTPGKVEAVLVGDTALTVGWDGVPRVEYYRVWIKVIGPDDELRPAGTTTKRNFTIEDLPSNTEVEVAVSAVNNGGESAKSEVYKVTTN